MDRQIEEADKTGEEKRSYSSGHLMCRASLWGLMGLLACGYFAWISFGHIMRNEYDWPHDAWTAATYIVWVLLLAGLMFDTSCWRERLFFGVLVLNFVIGFALTLWRTIPAHDVREARIATGALWSVAALASLSTMGRAGKVGR